MKHTGTFSAVTLNPGDLFLCGQHWRRVVRVRQLPWHCVEILHGRPLESGGLELTTLPETARVEVGII